jgi:hypothetical protein
MQPRFRRAAILLAIVAMALRALLPMGWMPNPSGFAQSPLVICLMDTASGADVSAMSHMDMSHDMSGMDMKKDHGQQQTSEPCPFAAAPHIAAPLAVADLVRIPERVHFAEKSSAVARLDRALHYQPQSPRAPPSFV